MEKVRIGVIGVGVMGAKYCEHILAGRTPELVLTAAARGDSFRRAFAEEPAAQSVALFDSGDALIDSGTCDAVLIATPHIQHPALAIHAFSRGLHVLCEKPAGIDTKHVRAMNEAAARSGKTFGMMYNQRTNSLYRKMREIVKDGSLGPVRRVQWTVTDWFRTQHYYGTGAWRATWAGEGGGLLLNQCPHNLDLLQWIVGMPTRVTAFCREGQWHDIEVEDDVTAYLEYPGGATGVFIASTGEAPGTNRLEIACDGGKLVCEDDRLMLYRNEESAERFLQTAQTLFGKPAFTASEVQTDGKNPQHVGVMNAFAAHILRGEPLVAPGEEGILGLTLSNAMHLSSWLQRPVTLPLDEDLFLRELEKKQRTK